MEKALTMAMWSRMAINGTITTPIPISLIISVNGMVWLLFSDENGGSEAGGIPGST